MIGVVMAGGRSTRMERDKATLVFRGLPMAEHVHRALAAVCDDVWLSVRRGQALPLPGLPAVRDAGTGPLGGLLAALESAPPGRALIAVACDMPLVSPALLHEVAARLGEHDASVPVAGGIDQVLCAAWSSRLAPLARELAEASDPGGRGPGLRDLLVGADVVRFGAGRWEGELRSFDRPGDLVQL